jgi:hypothetical protein
LWYMWYVQVCNDIDVCNRLDRTWPIINK